MSSSIPSWQILSAHVQPFRGARDLAFCLKVPLDSLLVLASSEGSGETARMRRLAWTFAVRTGCKYQIRLTRSRCPSFLRFYGIVYMQAFSVVDVVHLLNRLKPIFMCRASLIYWLTKETLQTFFSNCSNKNVEIWYLLYSNKWIIATMLFASSIVVVCDWRFMQWRNWLKQHLMPLRLITWPFLMKNVFHTFLFFHESC